MNRSELARIARKHGTPAGGDRPRRRSGATTPSFRRHLPQGAGLLRGQGQPGPGDRRARSTRRAPASTWPRCPSSCWCTTTSATCRREARQDFIWDKIIYANPIKPKETLPALDRYKPLVTYDNLDGAREDQALRARTPGWSCACASPNTGSMVELSSKFGCDPGRGGGPDRGGLPDRAGRSRASASTWAASAPTSRTSSRRSTSRPPS